MTSPALIKKKKRQKYLKDYKDIKRGRMLALKIWNSQRNTVELTDEEKLDLKTTILIYECSAFLNKHKRDSAIDRWEIDHCKPSSKNGEHTYTNLQIIPKSINTAKGRGFMVDIDLTMELLVDTGQVKALVYPSNVELNSFLKSINEDAFEGTCCNDSYVIQELFYKIAKKKKLG